MTLAKDASSNGRMNRSWIFSLSFKDYGLQNECQKTLGRSKTSEETQFQYNIQTNQYPDNPSWFACIERIKDEK
jgi:hypothetical protein